MPKLDVGNKCRGLIWKVDIKSQYNKANGWHQYLNSQSYKYISYLSVKTLIS